MLKLLNSVLLVVILCGGMQSINGETLQCKFEDFTCSQTFYTCIVTAFDNPNDTKIITGYRGVHQANKYDKDVKQIYILRAKNKYIPENLGSVFKITALIIQFSQLVVIRSKDFYGMQNLEYLSLYSNKLTSVSSDVFSTLTKLKQISLSSNQIKYIGSGAFDQLKNLNYVDLRYNICVNKDYVGATAITQLKHDIIVNCVDPLSTTTTTTTTTTTQNPMEVELEAAKKQQQNNEIELNKLRDDLKKEQSENIKVKIERDALMNDRESLKMELNNKTSESNELKTNCKPIEALDVKLNAMMEHLLKESKEHRMERQENVNLRAELSLAKDQQKTDLSKAKETMKRTINDLNTELMEVKIQRQLERNTYMGLRTKLMKTKEQLATCEINDKSLI